MAGKIYIIAKNEYDCRSLINEYRMDASSAVRIHNDADLRGIKDGVVFVTDGAMESIFVCSLIESVKNTFGNRFTMIIEPPHRHRL